MRGVSQAPDRGSEQRHMRIADAAAPARAGVLVAPPIQNAQICMAADMIGIQPPFTHNGGYRVPTTD
jgi:hypothetical protein